MVLAMETGIPFSTWIEEEPGVLATALELLEEQSEKANRR